MDLPTFGSPTMPILSDMLDEEFSDVDAGHLFEFGEGGRAINLKKIRLFTDDGKVDPREAVAERFYGFLGDAAPSCWHFSFLTRGTDRDVVAEVPFRRIFPHCADRFAADHDDAILGFDLEEFLEGKESDQSI